jgi:cysteine desulfurase
LLGENPSPKKLKSGTENIPAIAGFATAAKYVLAELEAELRRITELRSAFISQLNKRSYKCVIEGDAAHQSPYILGVRFPGMEGQFLMLECNQAGVAISTGSACQLANDKPNRTMKALGRTDEEARQFVRFSFGKDVKADQLDEIIAKIDTILKRHFDKVTWPST